MEENKQESPEYDGPYIPKTIEFYGSSGKDVELFGSWNRFKGGDELQYKGQNTYSIEVKLPLGNYVYRFLVDGEEWETNDDLGKTVKDGVEYNTISVRENEDESEEESEDEEEGEEEEGGDNGGGGEDKTLIYDEQTGGFVVGKAKKRRGRPSIEIELPTSLVEEAQKNEQLDKVDENKNIDDTNKTNNEEKPKTKKKRRKKGRRRIRGFGNRGVNNNVDLKALFKQKEEEWARMVFVQQLRQQQQHNDEIQRVKTLWKQERQVRVEMHKKVIQSKKKLEQDLTSVKGEVDKLKKQLEISKSGDERLASQLESELKKKNEQIEEGRNQIRKLEQQITTIRKEKVEFEKSKLEQGGEIKLEIKKLNNENNNLKQEIKSLKSQNQSLVNNLETVKSGNEEVRGIETQRFAEMQKNWEEERKELLTYKEESKKLKQDLSNKSEEYNKLLLDKKSIEQQCENEKNKQQQSDEKIKKLEKEIENLNDSTKKDNEIKLAVEKERSILESDKKILGDKLENMTKLLEQQKIDFEKELESNKLQSKKDLESLSQKSNKQTAERIEQLRKEISGKDDEIRNQKEVVNKVTSSYNEEKSKNESLNKQLENNKSELSDLKNKLNEEEKSHSDTKTTLSSVEETLSNTKNELESLKSSTSLKIEQLEKNLSNTKQSSDKQTKELENKVNSLENNIESLKKDLNNKGEESSKLSLELTNAKQEIETLKSKSESQESQIQSLNNNLDNERKSNENIQKEKDNKILELTTLVNNVTKEKDDKIHLLEDKLSKNENELESKLKEFSESLTTIEQLKTEISSNKETFEKQKLSYERQIQSAHKKDEKIIKTCKILSEKFSGFRSEMDDIRNKKIQQLEKMNEFFPSFKELLTKAFGFHQNLVDGLMEKYKKELTLRRKYFNQLQDLRGNIRVFCRVRPLLKFELEKGYSSCMKFPIPGQLVIKDDKGEHKFEFSQVYVPDTTQEQVSEDTTEYVQSVMDGYNVSIFAYGQTGSGKTYTMYGTKNKPGVNLRALRHLFKLAQERSPMFEYRIKVAVYEIYNEKIKDLIADVELKSKKKSKKNKNKNKKEVKIRVRHLPDGTVDVEGINWITVTSDNDVITLNNAANKNRSAGITDMNAHSSRSHMVLCVKVKGLNIPANIEYLGSLYLVDLAGSERVKKSGASGQALKEAQNINKSLSALGDVMQSLQKKAGFVPYRNSTLTEIMTNSLGGNAKTVMFINCCPTGEHAFETLSSLKFAKRVGKVELGEAKKTIKKSKRKN